MRSVFHVYAKLLGCANVKLVGVARSSASGERVCNCPGSAEVGKDAARFFFMMRRISSHLDFDLELAKRHSPENPVYYVQYAYARIANIIKNASTYKIGADLDLLKEPEELSLMRILLKYSYVLKQCVNIKDPCNITGYLQELAAAFHKFYDKHKVLVDEPHLRNARLTLIACVQIILSNSFSFLGISSPEKM